MKQIFLIFFAALLFSGNIGISVFNHICEDEGVSTSYFLSKNKCKENSGTESCCEKKQEKEKDCCSDELKIIQIHEKYLQNHFPSSIIIPEFNSLELFSQNLFDFTFKTDLLSKNWREPPPKSGKSILIKHHVLRI